MKPKTLVVLVVILAVLGALVYMRQSQRVDVSIVEQANMQSLTPEAVAAEDVDKVIVYTGWRAEKKVELAKTENGWQTASYHDAPVLATKIDPYIESVINVQGEFRVTAPEPELAEYGLSDDTAFHILGFSGDTPAFHVLVGESPKHKTVFMRAADSNDVYVTDASLKEDAGLFGNTEGMAASPDWWLDKSLLDIDGDHVTAIALTYPDKELRLERREVPRKEPAETPAIEGEDDAEAMPEPEPVEPEYEWVVAEGGMDKTLKTAAVDGILRKLGGMSATTIVNPEKKPDYRLDPPNFVASVTMDDGTQHAIHGGRPDPMRGTYITLPADEAGVVYSVSRFDFEDLFPFGSDFYDLDAPAIDPEQVDRIELRTPDTTAVLTRDGDSWTVAEPALTLAADIYKPGDIADAAAAISPKDYARAASHYGLDDPFSTATLQLAGGESMTIARGIASSTTDGHYAKLPGVEYPVVVESAELDKIFVKLSDLFDLTILNGVNDESITRLTLTRGEDSFVIEDQEMFWNVTAGDETFNADVDAIEDFLFGLTVLEAEDFTTDLERDAQDTIATISFDTESGKTFTLTVEEDLDLQHAVRASNHPELVLFVKLDAMERVLKGAEHFRPAPIEAEPVEAPPVQMVDPHAGHNH